MHNINPDPDFEKLSKHLFWEYDRSKLSFDGNARLVVHRVLEYGLLEDWIIIKNHYGVEQIAEIAMTLRSLEPSALSFIATVANKDLSKFRCYNLRPLIGKHWI